MIGKSKIFLYTLLSFVLGVGIASFGFRMSLLMLFSLLICFLILLILGFKNVKIRIISFCIIGLISGFWRYSLSIPIINQSLLSFYNGKEISFIGKVNAEPDVRKDLLKLTIEAESLENNQQKVKGNVLINTTLYPEYNYGDRLKITCLLRTPEKIEDFAYDKYLSRYNIYSVCYQPEIKLLEKNQGSLPLASIYQIKKVFISSVNKIFPEPQASFLGGLLLGAKRGIPDDLMTAFNRTGTTHIVAISGYNITIIVILMISLCKTLGISRKKSFWIILIGLFFFIVITGAQSSVIRAGIMGALVLTAKQLGRLSRITNALLLAAVIMLLINPKVLVFDAGFQLSFLATMGLVYLSPLLEKPCSFLTSRFQIKESFLATTSAVIFSTPLILYQFGRFSAVALVVNLLILPVIPAAMELGFITGLLGIVWLPLGKFFSWFCFLVLSYIIQVVVFFSQLPFASLTVSKFSLVELAVGYLLLASSIIIIYQKQSRSQFRGAARLPK